MLESLASPVHRPARATRSERRRSDVERLMHAVGTSYHLLDVDYSQGRGATGGDSSRTVNVRLMRWHRSHLGLRLIHSFIGRVK